MEEQIASRTAIGTSLMRALHGRADSLRILDDPWGERWFPDAARQTMQRLAPPGMQLPDDPAALQALADARLRAIPAYVSTITRSRYAEDTLLAAVARGVRQYVLLGAGFDSFALRAPAQIADVTICEIDHPATQGLKRARLAACGIVQPANLHFVPADFATEDLASVLARGGIDRARPAFIAWLGVTMYLTRRANLATLRAIAGYCAPGSELVFTYIDEQALSGAGSSRFTRMRRNVAALGEPFLCGFAPAGLARALGEIGYAVIEDVGTDALVRRYDPAGVNGWQASRMSRTLHARVA